LIGVINCIDNTRKIEHQKKKLDTAKGRIREFKILNAVFNNFKDFENLLNSTNELPPNLVLNLISSDYYKTGYIQSNLDKNPGTHYELKKLDESMVLFSHSNSVRSLDYKNVIKRLKSEKNFESIEAYLELIIGYEIAKKIGENNVLMQYQLPNGRRPDLVVQLGEKKVILELTGLNLSEPEVIINRIAEDVSKYILKKCKQKDFEMLLFIEPSRVLRQDTEGRIDERKTESVMHYALDNLYLEDLAGFEGTLDFEEGVINIDTDTSPESILIPKRGQLIYVDRVHNPDKSVNDSSHIAENSGTGIKNSRSYGLFELWSKKVRLNDFLNSPIQRISYLKGEDGCVHVNSIDFDTSNEDRKTSPALQTSLLAKQGFIKHISRSIKSKVKQSQYESGYPFVIAIRAHEWRFAYESEYDDFVPIRNNIQNFLQDYKEISGVILFTNSLYRGRYIENKAAHQQISKDLFEKYNILEKPPEPLFTHDRKIEFPKESEDKIQRITELIEWESKIKPKDENVLAYYAREDLEELFKNFDEFLKEDKIDEELLSQIDRVIKKYCEDQEYKEDESEQRNDPISENRIFLLGRMPLRAYAASSLILLMRHKNTLENMQFVISLSKDSNTYVRSSVCNMLTPLYGINDKIAVEIARDYCTDNKYIRWYLRSFLTYLYQKDKTKGLELFTLIISRYGKEELSKDGENILLRFAVSVITQTSLLKIDKKYEVLFRDLVTNEEYNIDVKREIIYSMREDRFILDDKVLKEVVNGCKLLLEHNSLEVKANVEFFLLYRLVERKVSLFPKIKILLDIISNIKYPTAILGYDHTYHFQILSYLEKFSSEFPAEASAYLIKIIDLNEFLIHSLHAHSIVGVLVTLFHYKGLDRASKEKLIVILKKIDRKMYWEASDLLDKIETNVL